MKKHVLEIFYIQRQFKNKPKMGKFSNYRNKNRTSRFNLYNGEPTMSIVWLFELFDCGFFLQPDPMKHQHWKYDTNSKTSTTVII